MSNVESTLRVEPPRIWLIRHGATEWSLRGKHTGRSDVPLLPEGRAEAKRLGAHLQNYSFAHVLVSPLLRARQTCELAGFGPRAEVLPDLAEWDYGDYEGKTSHQIHQHAPSWSLFRDGCPGGESTAQVSARLDRAIGDVLTRWHQSAADVAIFSHGHALRVFALRYLGWPLEAGAQLLLDTTAICRLKDERGRRSIELWNDRSHLRPR